MGLNYTIAFLGGFVTFLAPCGAFLLPAFFALATSSRRALLLRLMAFILGLWIALIPLGIAAGGLGNWLRSYQSTIVLVAGLVIIIAGLLQALNISLPVVPLPGFAKTRSGDSTSVIGVLLLGITYGLAGVGCTGPILGAVLTTAATTSSIALSVSLMICYGLGMFTPVAILALLWNTISANKKAWFRPRPLHFLGRNTTWGGLFSGLVFVILGIFLILTGGSTSGSILDPAAQRALEIRIGDTLNSVPNFVFPLFLFAIIGLIVSAWWYFRSPKDPNYEDGDADTSEIETPADSNQ